MTEAEITQAALSMILSEKKSKRQMPAEYRAWLQEREDDLREQLKKQNPIA